ncbi:fluoride efflux transporter CrcB [Hellea balneolensis]|uniref:fluoride efflux transporter CrcB n=1 Tax=Hellea balneolensis TaxID=287478 RepID=UPI00041C228D|nr:fluoride efflux transporter CrcB [Hellea balneolensis]
MSGILYVALGGALGASARHVLGVGTLKAFGPGYPHGTMAANVIGGFLMGILAGWLALKVSGHTNLRLFLGVGLLGGFTTFSAFSLDAVLMYEKKAYGALLGYVGGSVILSIGALMMGLILARKVFGSSAGVM